MTELEAGQAARLHRLGTESVLNDDVIPDDVLTNDGATLLAAKLKTSLQIGQHLV